MNAFRAAAILKKMLSAVSYASLLCASVAVAADRENVVATGNIPADWKLDADYRHAPPEAVERWKDWKFGIRIHWGYYSLIGGSAGHAVTCIPGRQGYPSHHASDLSKEWAAFYTTLYQYFDPDRFDAEEWMDLFERSGIKYFTFTTKHTDGFCMWPTKTKRRVACQVDGMERFGEKEISFSIADTPYGKDIVGPLVAAARRRNVGIGLYYSHGDWIDPAFAWDKFNMHFDPKLTKQSEPKRWQAFIEQERQQLHELTTQYGPIDLISFDWEWPQDAWPDLIEITKMVRRNQPNVLMRNRGIGPYGDFETPERWVPADASDPKLGMKNWQVIYTCCEYWSYRADDRYKSQEWLLETLIDVCAKGGNFQVGFGPNAKGTWPKEVVERLEYAGRWLKVNGEAIYGTRPWEHWNDGEAVRYTRSKDGKYVYAIVLKWPGRSLVLSRIAAKPGTEIHMPGVAAPLEWRMTDRGLSIEIPPGLQAEASRPCQQAYVFRIEGTPYRRAAAPEMTILGGLFGAKAMVGLRSREEGTEIRYTLDGTEPTLQSAVCPEKIEVPRGRTLHVQSFKPGLGPSSVVDFTPGVLKINFQPKEVPVPDGYLPDYGEAYGLREAGLEYGWSRDHSDQTRRRTDDALAGTLCHFLDGQKWEVNVPNGRYEVAVCVGDAGSDLDATLNVEGVNYCKGLKAFQETTVLAKAVTVTDGRLTLDNGDSTNRMTKIAFVTIRRLD